MAAHAGRKTVTVRDFDVIRNLLLTIDSGSSGTPGFLTEQETKLKIEKLKEGVLERVAKRKGGGAARRAGRSGPSNGGQREGEEGEEEGGEGDGDEAQGGGEEGIGEE